MGLRALMGLAVGLTLVAIVMSPWGQQSGGHFNPALTVAFYRMNKMYLPDALLYVVAQFSGATVGVCVARLLFISKLILSIPFAPLYKLLIPNNLPKTTGAIRGL